MFSGTAPYWGAESEAGDRQPDNYRIPLCSVSDQDEQYILVIELPGMAPEQIDLEVGPWEVAVSAQPAEAEDGERVVPFFGSLVLPEEVDPASSDVSYEHGVLTLTLGKVEHRTRKRVQVGTSSARKKRETSGRARSA
jgi:HSP20 family molecular chaperone IbpA